MPYSRAMNNPVKQDLSHSIGTLYIYLESPKRNRTSQRLDSPPLYR